MGKIERERMANIHLIRIQRGERGMGLKALEEIMAQYFLNLTKNIILHIQEAEWTTNRITPKKSKPRHFKIKLLKTKEERKSWKQPEKNDTLQTKEN